MTPRAAQDIRAVYFDLDGTLLDDDVHGRSGAVGRQSGVRVGPVVRHVLGRLQESGIRVGIATGRMFQSARPYLDASGCDAPAILFNGARVADPVTNQAYFQAHLAREAARLALEVAGRLGIHVNLYRKDRYFMESDDPWARAFIAKETYEPQWVASLMDLLDHDPVKLLLIGDPGRLSACRQKLAERLGSRAMLVFSEPEFLEVLPAAMSKADGMIRACRVLGIGPEQVAAFGDGPNDSDMLTTAGIGVAVANARQEVKEAADVVAPFAAAKGVVWALQRIFSGLDLIHEA